MNQQQLLLTQLLGSKELTFGCQIRYSSMSNEVLFVSKTKDKIRYVYPKNGNSDSCLTSFEFEIIGNTANLSDLHRWMNLYGEFVQNCYTITFTKPSHNYEIEIQYDPSKYLLEQSPETLDKIIEVIQGQKKIELSERKKKQNAFFDKKRELEYQKLKNKFPNSYP